MLVNMDLAYQADKLARSGLRGKELGVRLKVTTPEANRLAAVGAAERQRQSARLTPPELALLKALVAEHVDLLKHGETRSPKTPDVSWRAGKSAGWAATTAQKRLFDEKWDDSVRMYVEGFGFVHVAGNGYMWLTRAGWALVHAMGLTDG